MMTHGSHCYNFSGDSLITFIRVWFENRDEATRLDFLERTSIRMNTIPNI